MHNEQDTNRPKATESIRLPARMPRSCGFLRINSDGALDVELYDHGDTAHSLFGNDVSTFYTVPAAEWPVLTASLQQGQTNAEALPRRAAQVDWTDTSPATLPQRLADAFLDIDELLHWLKSSEVAFHTRTDSWV